MTIDEAILLERETVRRNKMMLELDKLMQESHAVCFDKLKREKCIRIHEQLAEWLEELKDYRDKNKMVVRIDAENVDSVKDKIDELSKYAESQYNKAIDDLSNTLKENYDYLPQIFTQEAFVRYIDEYAEQLKAGAEE